MPWPGTTDLQDHTFLACNGRKLCEIDGFDVLRGVDPSWREAVGANGITRVESGARHPPDPSSCDFCNGDHQRTAAGISADRRTLILVVAEGRLPGIRGPSLHELANFIADQGAYDAVCFDGGGSSQMMVTGTLVNRLSEHPRRVASQLAVVHDPNGFFPGPPKAAAMARAGSSGGYWLVDDSGAVRARGGAVHFGGASHLDLARPIVGMAATPSGDGYFLVAEDFGLFTYGDATFAGN